VKHSCTLLACRRRVLPRSVFAMLVMLFPLTGCQSTRFGAMPVRETTIRASLGGPTTPDENAGLAPTAAQEPMAQSSEEGVQSIDLETSLQLAGAENPTIAIAEEAVRASLALRMQARALLFPTLDAGSNLRIHRGNLLTARGRVIDVDLQSLYYGFGADVKGAGTVAVPGLRLVSHLADAYYAPRAAQARVVASRFDAATTRQYLLMEVGIRYLALAEAEARRAAYRQSLKEFAEIERLTTNHAKSGLGRDSDAQRSRAESAFVRADLMRTNEETDVAAAELARLLDLDPSARLRAADVVPPLLELVDQHLTLPDLLEQTRANHPEIVARSADVDQQEIRLKQERMRPFLPTVAVGFSAGDFGGGNIPRFKDFAARTDFDVVAVWSMQNLLMGNRAVQNVSRAGLEMAHAALTRTIDRIHQEVAEAHAVTQARQQEIDLARTRVATSLSAYEHDLTRIKNAKGLPLEVLQSAKQLAEARQDLVRAMVGYSQAQLRLYAAMGNTPGGR